MVMLNQQPVVLIRFKWLLRPKRQQQQLLQPLLLQIKNKFTQLQRPVKEKRDDIHFYHNNHHVNNNNNKLPIPNSKLLIFPVRIINWTQQQVQNFSY